MSGSSDPKGSLVRGLTLTHATALAVGTVIGTGVFLKTATMSQILGSPALVLAAWVVAGLLSIAGTLTFAELAALMPEAGGEYVYLRSSYGKAVAFFNGWMGFAVGAGGLSALAVGFATFLAALAPLDVIWAQKDFMLFGNHAHWQFGLRELVAVGILLLFGAVNCAGVAVSSRVQSVFTGLKILSIVFIAGGVGVFSKTGSTAHWSAPAQAADWPGSGAFGAALLAALWAYDGWAYMPMMAGEVRNPQRNVPRALIGGIAIVMALYVVANLTYFYALPFAEVATSNSTAFREAPPVAAKAASAFLGADGAGWIVVIFLISVMGVLQGVILASARVPFAMARDGLFPARLGAVQGNSHTPVWAVIALTLWACVIAVSGSFDQITTMVVLGRYLFHALTTAGLFILRRRMASAERPFRTPGYPAVPGLFLAVALWLVANALKTNPLESLAGLGLISSGLPVYLYYRARATETAKT